MRWFLDTEFNDDGRAVELISIGLVSDGGHEYYAHYSGYDPSTCNEWVQKNVLPKLAGVPQKPRNVIRDEIRALVDANGKPEFWAYFADYDWVVFCQLFGRMMDLPPKWPQFCMDLVQVMATYGIRKESLPPQPPGTEHNALDDARWVRDALAYLTDREP